MGITGFLRDWWWAIGEAVLALVVLYRDHPDSVGGSTPGMRCCSRSRCSGRPSSTPWSSASAASSRVVSAGVSLTEGLAVTTEAMRNRVYMQRLER